MKDKITVFIFISYIMFFSIASIIVKDKEISNGVPCLLKMKFTDKSGKVFYLVDYASAGKDWDTEIAAWLKIK